LEDFKRPRNSKLQKEFVIMADTILLSCPECNKQLRTPSNLQGKKIRCKACGHTFLAKAQDEGEHVQAGPGKGKAKAPAKKGPKSDLEPDFNPYAVTDTDLSTRCPHCAGEMESEDAVICLHCGYNTQTRERHEVKMTYHMTGTDVFLWLLPGIVCALVFFSLIGFIIFLIISLKDIVEANKEAWWVFGLKAMQVWGTVISLAIMFFCAKFAIRRLIQNPTPPERLKR
jgi:DNA-directed RNA polymerase subunit RPC12/RpoP